MQAVLKCQSEGWLATEEGVCVAVSYCFINPVLPLLLVCCVQMVVARATTDDKSRLGLEEGDLVECSFEGLWFEESK